MRNSQLGAGAAQQDEDAAELNEAEVVQGVTLLADDEPTEIAEPSEEAFDLPPAFVSTQRTAVLRFGLLPVAPVRRNHLDAQLGQLNVKRVSSIGAVADEALRQLRDTSGVEGRGEESALRAGEAEAAQTARGRPKRSAPSPLP